MNYQGMENLLRGKQSRNIPSIRSTSVHRIDDNTIAIRYHNTDVVTYRRDGSCVLNSGGWRTLTTKCRINEYSPACVSQDKGIWYVDRGYRAGDNPRDGHVFADGMIIKPDGSIEYPDGVTPDDPRAIAKQRKQINAYAREYVNRLAAGKIERPSGGDCWYCSLKSQNGKTMGDEFKDRDHLLSHLEDGYYVPSIAANLIRDNVGELSVVAKDWIACKLDIAANADDKTRDQVDRAYRSIAMAQARHAIANYFFKRLGMAGTRTTYLQSDEVRE